ncbi:MAG: nuclear transport factor 2 family protein [Myxococcota bacterium]
MGERDDELQVAFLEDRVARLERMLADALDRESIRELAARYCHAVAAGGGVPLVDLFTDDGCMASDAIPTLGRPASETRGRDALTRVYGEFTTRLVLRPFIHNHVVDLDGDAASGACSVEIRAVEDGVAYDIAGHYRDRYRREGGIWKFERRHFVVDYWVRAPR